MKSLSKKDVSSAIKYLFVGGSSSLLELVLFQIFIFLSINTSIANVIAVIIATAYNFVLNRSWSFGDQGNAFNSLIRYLILFAFNTTFSTVVITLVSNLGVPAILVKVFTMGCIALWNFFLYRSVVFKTARGEGEHDE